MLRRVKNWVQASRERKRERIARDYGFLTEDDKHVIDAFKSGDQNLTNIRSGGFEEDWSVGWKSVGKKSIE